MQTPRTGDRRSLKISLTIVFSATTIVLALSRLKIPFPLLPFLTFRFEEIVCATAYLLLGLKYSLAVTFIEFMALNLGKPYHLIIGPLMKFAAITFMLVGFEFAGRLRKLGAHTSKIDVALLLAMGICFRASMMAALTFAIYYIIFPELYIPFSRKTLPTLINVQDLTDIEIVMIMVALTSIFNILHVPFSLLPAVAIKNFLMRSGVIKSLFY